MPGLITHYICGEAVLNTIHGDLNRMITENRRLYNVGAQGPDIFFYYLTGLIKKSTKNLGIKMHENNFGSFMRNMAENIKATENKNDREAAAAYLCGYITHYALDKNAHPYIYYKSGFRREGEIVRGLKFSVNHRNFETAIDVAMLNLVNGEKPRDKKLWQLIKVSKKEAMAVSAIIGEGIRTAYNSPVTAKEVYKSMAYMIGLTRLMQSNHGRRKRIMEFVEEMTIGDKICSSLIHSQDLSDELDYLNSKKAPWRLPWDENNEQILSFTEMFDKACEDSKIMQNSLYSYLKSEMSIDELMDIAGDYSLKTGLEGSKKVIFYCHDIIFDAKKSLAN